MSDINAKANDEEPEEEVASLLKIAEFRSENEIKLDDIGSTTGVSGSGNKSMLNRMRTQIIHLDQKYADHKVATDTVTKCVVSGGIIAGIAFAFSYKNISGYQLIAFILMLYHFIHWTQFIYLLLSTNRMSCLKILTTEVEGFGHLTFPSQREYHPSECIMSLSELCAIRGSNVYGSLYGLFTNTATLLFCAVGFKWHEIENNISFDNEHHLSLICGLIAAIGIGSLGMWELNAYSKIHQIMHYISIVAMSGFYFAILFQANWSFISIIICIINTVLWCIYFPLSTVIYKKRYENDSHKVHKVTFHCIMVETNAWLASSAALVYYTYNLHSMNV